MGKTTYCVSHLFECNDIESIPTFFHILVQDLLINKNLPNSCCFSNFAMCSTGFQKLHPMLIVDNAQFFLTFNYCFHEDLIHFTTRLYVCRIKNYLPLFDCTFFVGFWLYRHCGCVLVSSKLCMGQWSRQYEVCS